MCAEVAEFKVWEQTELIKMTRRTERVKVKQSMKAWSIYVLWFLFANI